MITIENSRHAAIYGLYAAFFYVSVLLIYRLAFHPLRAYPGPLLARLTDAYGGFQALQQCSHLTIQQNHVKFGPVFRQGPNRLVFNTATALQDIYLNPKANKSHLYLFARANPKSSVFELIDVDEHRERRKIISQPIKEQAMRGFEPIMADQINTFLQLLSASAHKSEPVDMTESCQNLAGDVIGHLAFGYHLDLQNNAENRWLLWGFSFTGVRLNIYMQFPLVARVEGLLRFMMQRLRKRYHGILQKMIKSRTGMKKDAQPDLYSYAVDSIGGDSVKGGSLWAEATFFIIAGAGTVTTTMSSLFFYLSRYPECYALLANEIRTKFSSLEEIQSGQKLRSCEYLRACINEALRMSSPNTSVLWREGLVREGNHAPLVVDGHVIPPGTQVGISLYSLHHNEKYFPDSFVFNPGRWLTPEAKQPDSITQKAFAPFSVGPHACAGRALAYLETSLTIAKTMFAFDFKAATGKAGNVGAGQKGSTGGRDRVKEFQLYDRVGAAHDGPMLVFKSRNIV